MADEPTPSADAHELWRTSNEIALALVDTHLGVPTAWSASAMLEYRLAADFQADWKAEVGHWLHAAKQFGFLEPMLRPLLGERDRRSRSENRDIDDPRHLKLHQHLASALLCHYFTGIGWSFKGWDTETGGTIDIDLALNTPEGTLVELQVKSPGSSQDADSRLIQALENAVQQLPREARSVAMVAIFAQRPPFSSLTGKPATLIHHLFGSTLQRGTEVFLPREAFGQFMLGNWNEIAGVVVIDLLRGADTVRYPCTVLLNPNATRLASPDWFPRSRVLTLEGRKFRWVRGEPWDEHDLPKGTTIEGEVVPRGPTEESKAT
jgi:hypothetical protein